MAGFTDIVDVSTSDLAGVSSAVTNAASTFTNAIATGNAVGTALGAVGAAITTGTGDPGLVASDKRLAVVRPRSSHTIYSDAGGGAYTSDRGQISKLRLLKNPEYDLTAAARGFKADISKDAQALLSDAGFTNIFITGFQAAFSEKTQVMTTFGDNEVVYYFGKQPITVSITGMLFDSIENDWFSKFVTLYSEVLRGSQLARNFCLVEITFPNMVMTGSISSLSTNQDSARDTDIMFSMQFIAKDVVPLPVQVPKGVELGNIGTLVDWSADRTGVQSYTLGSGTIGGGFLDTFNPIQGFFNQSIGNAATVGQALTTFRTSIFTPVFGVISSITKIVKSVTGSIASIISSFTNPVNQILRDITSVATRASALALLVESSVNDVINIPLRTISNLKNTLSSLKGAAGIISRVPESISESFKRLHATGRVARGAAILSSGKTRKKSKAAVLSSGTPYNPSKSNTL